MREGTGFRDLSHEFARFNTVIVGCSRDSVPELKKFAARRRLPFTLVSDGDGSICVAYGACDSREESLARRIAYLIDEEGRIVEAHGVVEPAAYPAEQLRSIEAREASRRR